MATTTTTEEGWHTLHDGTKLYTKTWKPDPPPRALLIFIHGFSDHSNTHSALFTHLASRSIQSFAFDQRGWGRSVTTRSTRGLTGPTAQVLADIASVVRALLFLLQPSPPPLFLMGHSMGGAEVLHFAARGPAEVRRQIRGYLVESPWIALHPTTQPGRALVAVGRLASRVLPGWQLVQRVEAQWVSRDEEECAAYAADPLCHDTCTLEGMAGCLARAAELDLGGVVLTDLGDGEGEGEGGGCRLWVGHGTEDRVTSFEASERFVKRLGIKDKEFKAYEGWYHKLHAEPGQDKITFANDVADWILARAGAAVEPASTRSPAKSRL